MELLFELQETLLNKFDLRHAFGRLDHRVVFHTFPFESQYEGSSADESSSVNLEGNFLSGNSCNRYFRYAVFEPVHKKKDAHAIVLLHGLNERKWGKYLVWAYKLADWTGAPVILFPLANHMNRSPEAWAYPRKMSEFVRQRKTFFGPIQNSSFANVALSSRLDKTPEVFISSGLQSIQDLVKLTGVISAGNHPLFSEGTEVDFFSYSIGALVTEILLMSNPDNLFSSSKAFLFCGGSTFDQMDGRSKNILDNKAYESLSEFVRSFEIRKSSGKLFDVLKPFGNSVLEVFRSMVSFNYLRSEREWRLKSLAHRIKALGLSLDKVIPGQAIFNTFCGGQCSNVSVADFDFKYSHEMPFPINDFSIKEKVENAFNSVFEDASFFLKR
ncbi:DUF6051 family protein [Marinilabilia salmonicolor]|uniref:DUF6051 family protein n=1 Tax=Marinilabilia salmonicolor TaxID=989 RepID=UPI00029A97EB|nr:DUF6051 family protein [Marinilabilia salmonicolor]